MSEVSLGNLFFCVNTAFVDEEGFLIPQEAKRLRKVALLEPTVIVEGVRRWVLG